MFASWKRWTARARFTLLLNHELPAPAAEALRLRIAADPLLAAQFDQFTATVNRLHDLPAVVAPPDFARDLAIERALAEQPLRETFGSLINGDLAATEARSLRDQIDAVPGLTAELRWVEAAVTVARELPAVPVPARFAEDLRRRLAAETAPARRPARLTAPRFAWGLAALFAIGLGVAGFLVRQSSPSAVRSERYAVTSPRLTPAKPQPETAPSVEPEANAGVPAEPAPPRATAPAPKPTAKPLPAPPANPAAGPVRVARVATPRSVSRRAADQPVRVASPTPRPGPRRETGTAASRPVIRGPIARPAHSGSAVRIVRAARDVVLSPASAASPSRTAMTVASVQIPAPGLTKRRPQPAGSTIAFRPSGVRLARLPSGATRMAREIPDPTVLNSAPSTALRFDGPDSRAEVPRSTRPRTLEEPPPDHVFGGGPRFELD